MKKMILLLLLAIITLNTGCASYMVHSNWVQTQKSKSIVIDANNNHIMVGLDITALSYIKENWATALGAAALDAATAYGAYKLIDNVNNNTIIIENNIQPQTE